MQKNFYIGQKVQLISRPPYLKTADTMPMLRPPDLININEEGQITDFRPGDFWVVRFSKGSFLLDSQYIN